MVVNDEEEHEAENEKEKQNNYFYQWFIRRNSNFIFAYRSVAVQAGAVLVLPLIHLHITYHICGKVLWHELCFTGDYFDCEQS